MVTIGNKSCTYNSTNGLADFYKGVCFDADIPVFDLSTAIRTWGPLNQKVDVLLGALSRKTVIFPFRASRLHKHFIYNKRYKDDIKYRNYRILKFYEYEGNN